MAAGPNLSQLLNLICFFFIFGMPNIFQIVKRLIHFDVLSTLEVQRNLLPPCIDYFIVLVNPG